MNAQGDEFDAARGEGRKEDNFLPSVTSSTIIFLFLSSGLFVLVEIETLGSLLGDWTPHGLAIAVLAALPWAYGMRGLWVVNGLMRQYPTDPRLKKLALYFALIPVWAYVLVDIGGDLFGWFSKH
jgi:hypothetical protein